MYAAAAGLVGGLPPADVAAALPAIVMKRPVRTGFERAGDEGRLAGRVVTRPGPIRYTSTGWVFIPTVPNTRR